MSCSTPIFPVMILFFIIFQLQMELLFSHSGFLTEFVYFYSHFFKSLFYIFSTSKTIYFLMIWNQKRCFFYWQVLFKYKVAGASVCYPRLLKHRTHSKNNLCPPYFSKMMTYVVGLVLSCFWWGYILTTFFNFLKYRVCSLRKDYMNWKILFFFYFFVIF